MDQIIRHQILPEGNGYKVILFLDQNETECASELGTVQRNNPYQLDNIVQTYIREKIPNNIIVKTVQIMIGSVILSTISLNGNHFNSTTAEASTINANLNSTYTVKAGDTLYGIAKQFQVSVDQLKKVNTISSNIISIGQVLTIPTNTVPLAQTTVSYKVVSGDSLWAISKKYGTTVDAIRNANNLTSDRLFVGQSLVIPASGSAQAQAEAQPIKYTVKAGETLYSIARQFNITVNAIKQQNQLSTDVIRIGQVLTLSGSNASVSPPAATTIDSSVSTLQKQLQVLGYYTVPAMAGTLDSATTEAIKSFQSDYSLPVTGTGDAATKTAIEHALVKKALVQDTNNYIGVPYRWGGVTPQGFDCSGFVYFMFNKHGVDMGRATSGSLFTKGAAIDRNKLQPGDLVFFGVNTPGVVSHVGFYVGENKFVSATSSNGIQVVSLDSTYWSKYYMGAKRAY